MSRFTAILVLALSALLVSSCKSKQDPQSPPEVHNCLAYWDADVEYLLPRLSEQWTAKGKGWARHQQDEPTYLALRDLAVALAAAIEAPPLILTPWQPTKAGEIPQAKLDEIRDRAVRMRSGGVLDGDQVSTAHPLTVNWMLTLTRGGPTPPHVIARANEILAALKEAVDM